jgi:hypothetical protein
MKYSERLEDSGGNELEEKFEKLNGMGREIKITLSEKSFNAMKVMYACGGHELDTFSEFVTRAAESGLEARLYEDVSDEVAARIYLVATGKDPFILETQLSQATGMPAWSSNSRGLFSQKRNYSHWGSVWRKTQFVPWYGVPPRWLRKY